LRSRARTGRGLGTARAIVAALAVGLAACIDFVEPDLPELGAPVVLQVGVVIVDVVSAGVDARLAPGLDADGFRRSVSRAALRVAGVAIDPDTVLRNGTHVYDAELVLARSPADPILIEAPAVDDVAAPPPVARWFTVRRVGPDTVRLAAGADLVLVLDTSAAAPDPPPATRQWVLALTGANGTFTIASTGIPPDTLVVPARWLPAPADGVVQARLVAQQSAQLRPPPGDYVALLTLDTRITWTVLVEPAVAPAAGPED
jgi:hypothetical protein